MERGAAAAGLRVQWHPVLLLLSLGPAGRGHVSLAGMREGRAVVAAGCRLRGRSAAQRGSTFNSRGAARSTAKRMP